MKIRRELWPFWATRDRRHQWKKGAQGIGNPPKMVEKHTCSGHFFVFFGVRGPFGSRRVPGPGISAKNVRELVSNLARFRAVFVFRGAFFRVFFCVFSGTPMLRILGDFVAQG